MTPLFPSSAPACEDSGREQAGCSPGNGTKNLQITSLKELHRHRPAPVSHLYMYRREAFEECSQAQQKLFFLNSWFTIFTANGLLHTQPLYIFYDELKKEHKA
jgi:hypothetical protein